MSPRRRALQRGQAIVLIGLILVVLFGFLGLAMDGGRGYLDRRHMQSAVDAAALAAAYNYMNTTDYGQAEVAATDQFSNNQELYTAPSCSGYGSASVSCQYSDSTNEALTLTVTNYSISGVTFTATASHQVPITIMQILGFGSTMTIGATATALARKTGSNGAAIQTLAPYGCGGAGGNSLTFQGNSTTIVTGDVWSNGDIFDVNAVAGGSVNGNIVDICGTPPALQTPTPWTVTGVQANGFTLPDPDYPMPPLNATAQSWNMTSGSTESPGTYASDPKLAGSAGCYFLAAGVYSFAGGFSTNGGFVSNKLRPPDEPFLATTTGPLSGHETAIPVNALAVAVAANTSVVVAGQAFQVTSPAAVGATSITVANTLVVGTIPSGTTVVTMSRAANQFWDGNKTGCGSSFSLTAQGSTGFSSGTYSVEVTVVRWEPNGVASCNGPATSTCYERESAPSMCRTIPLATSGNIKVAVTTDPGAQGFNVYLASNSTCTGLTFCKDTGGSSSVTISTCTGGSAPPDEERPPLFANIPNQDPPAATPPSGDMANEHHCVNPSSGSAVACPSAWTPGAVVFYLGGAGSPCLVMHGGGDMYIYSGYQFSRVVLYLPGPEQSSTPNTCSGNIINGNGATSVIGVIYMPSASVTINGNSAYEATIAGGIIAWTATITGTGDVAITADPTLRSWPPAVRLTQ